MAQNIESLILIDYVEKGKSLINIQNEYNMTKYSVSKILKKANITKRSKQEQWELDIINSTKLIKKEMISKLEKGYSKTNLANIYNLTEDQMNYFISYYKIEYKSFNESGSKKVSILDNEHKIYTVYKWTNIINNKVYIGITNNLKRRTKEHKLSAQSKTSKKQFANALRKYGIENFEMEVLFTGLTQKEAAEKEIELIEKFDSYKNGYNSTIGGEGSKLYIENEFENIEELMKTKTNKELAAYYNVKVSTINRYLHQNELTRDKYNTLNKLSEEERQYILNLFTNKELANIYNVSVGSISTYLDHKNYKRSLNRKELNIFRNSNNSHKMKLIGQL